MSVISEQLRFEAWYSEKFPETPIEMLRGEGSYWHNHTYGCWLAWQASSSSYFDGWIKLSDNRPTKNDAGSVGEVWFYNDFAITPSVIKMNWKDVANRISTNDIYWMPKVGKDGPIPPKSRWNRA